MKAIVTFISTLPSLINILLSWFEQFVGNSIAAIKYLGIAVTTAFKAIISMPVWLQEFASACIAISIIYIILGRDSGGAKQ